MIVEIGSAVLYTDDVGIEHQALVTQAWVEEALEKGGQNQEIVNLCYVSDDINKQDCNGRVLEFRRVVMHQDTTDATTDVVTVVPVGTVKADGKSEPAPVLEAVQVSKLVAASSGSWRACSVVEGEPIKEGLKSEPELLSDGPAVPIEGIIP